MAINKKVLLILPHQDFDDEEYKQIKNLLERANIHAETGSSHLSEAQGKEKLMVAPDALIGYVEAADYDGFIFIGEEGAQEFFNQADIARLINKADLAGKMLAGIGKAVLILAYSGKLTNIRVAGEESDKGRLEELGAYFTGKRIEVARNFITASDVSSIKEFAEAIVKHLSWEKTGYLE